LEKNGYSDGRVGWVGVEVAKKMTSRGKEKNAIN
jgi:hypothetical protein